MDCRNRLLKIIAEGAGAHKKTRPWGRLYPQAGFLKYQFGERSRCCYSGSSDSSRCLKDCPIFYPYQVTLSKVLRNP